MGYGIISHTKLKQGLYLEGCFCDTCIVARGEERPEVSSKKEASTKEASDGSTASYYELPPLATELQHLISFKNMNAQIGEIQRAVYRYGEVEHSGKERDLKKIIFYAQAELDRLSLYSEKAR